MCCKYFPSFPGVEMAKTALTRDEVLSQLRKHKPELERKFGVATLALVGSVARDEASEGSDIDLMITFDQPATSKTFFGVQFYIEDLMDHPVDLISEKYLKENRRSYFMTEAVYV